MLLKQFYSVISSTCNEGQFVTCLKINKKHPLYKGHFPSRPVTPGVILMQLFKEEAERRFNCKLQLETASNVKFLAVVDPNENDNFKLESQIEQEGSKILLKGTGFYNNSVALKISSIYTLI